MLFNKVVHFYHKLFKSNRLSYCCDIQSIEPLKKTLKQKYFDLIEVNKCIDALATSDDEIMISVPTESIYSIRLSIWGVDSELCELERVCASKGGSYHIKATKKQIKALVYHISDVADDPESFGLKFNEWQ